MSFLLDTNVISELRKGKRASPNVREWLRTVDDEDLYLSVLVIGEIRQGIERAQRTLRGVRGAWVKEQRVNISGTGEIEFQANILVTFVLED